MLLSTLSLATAASAFVLPITTESIHDDKDIWDKCTIIRDPTGDSIYNCPGCLLIVDKDGKLKLRTGEHCSRYCDGDDKEELKVVSHKDCQIIKLPNGDTLSQCPGCQKIVDKDGKTKLEQGPKCKHHKALESLLGEAYEAGLLMTQE